MSTFSTNLKVQSKVNINGTAVGAVVYTVPANCYAVLNFFIYGGNGNSLDGFTTSVYLGSGFSTGHLLCGGTATENGSARTIYLGPEETVFIRSGGAAAAYRISGVVFANTQ